MPEIPVRSAAGLRTACCRRRRRPGQATGPPAPALGERNPTAPRPV